MDSPRAIAYHLPMQFAGRGFVAWVFTAAAFIGCGAESPDIPDASRTRADARTTTPRPDARGFPPTADAQSMPDAAPDCSDPNEDNNTSATAFALVPSNGSFTDCDDTGGTISGAAQNTDLDWFTYSAEDVNFCGVDPTVSIASGNVEVCLFVTCTGATTELTCPQGTTDATDGALVGCCSTSGFTIDSFNCDGTLSDDATSHIRVKAAQENMCIAYSIGYHY